MFDIAKYYNDGTRIEMNCQEHYDPGVLSISLRSTQPGLELKDENGKWMKMPINKKFAVIWAGDAAAKMNPLVKRGIHRVVNPSKDDINKPRLSMWYEICTTLQEHTELLYEPSPKISPTTSPKISQRLIEKSPVFKAKKFEEKTGIPMSKSLSPEEQKARKNPKIQISRLSGMPIHTNVNYNRIFNPYYV